MGTDQRKRGYRSKNINSCGYRSEKAWVQIKEHKFLLVQIRESVGTDPKKAWVQIKEHKFLWVQIRERVGLYLRTCIIR